MTRAESGRFAADHSLAKNTGSLESRLGPLILVVPAGKQQLATVRHRGPPSRPFRPRHQWLAIMVTVARKALRLTKEN